MENPIVFPEKVLHISTYREIISFYGRTIQVSEILFTQIYVSLTKNVFCFVERGFSGRLLDPQVDSLNHPFLGTPILTHSHSPWTDQHNPRKPMMILRLFGSHCIYFSFKPIS
jgi:hypothetical protein